jgi:hypothetical protein
MPVLPFIIVRLKMSVLTEFFGLPQTVLETENQMGSFHILEWFGPDHLSVFHPLLPGGWNCGVIDLSVARDYPYSDKTIP